MAFKKEGEKLSTRVCGDGTRGSSSKLKEGRFRLVVRKKFFHGKVGEALNRLHRESGNALSLEVFKVRLGEAASNLV